MTSSIPRSRSTSTSRRSSKKMRARVSPIAQASRSAISALMQRTRSVVKPVDRAPNARGPAQPTTQWRVESLEPRLLLSADAIPAVHLLSNDPPGGTGNTYIFNRGDGADWVDAYYDASPSKLNTLQFGTGVSPTDLVVRRVIDGQRGDNVALELAIAGSSDSVQVRSFFLDDDPRNPSNPVQQVKFADGTIWDLKTLANQAFLGSAGNDALRGTVGADSLQGQAGADTLVGLSGADVLDGGSGLDVLDGGPGNNLYLFGKGDGQDTVLSYLDATAGKLNTLQFKAGVAPAEVTAALAVDSQWGGNPPASE